MDVIYPRPSRSAKHGYEPTKPSFEQGITLFPLSSKGSYICANSPFLPYSHPQESSLAWLCVACHSPSSLSRYCAENLSGQPQGQDYHLTLEGFCSSVSRMSAFLSGRGKKRKANTNNTVQSISISPLVAGRKRLVVSNLTKERAEKLSPDSILPMPLLPASLKRAEIPR